MILKADDHAWKKQFARSAAYRAEQQHFFREAERRHKETLRADRFDDDVSDLAITAVLATEAQIFEFRVKLEDYRTVTVEFLLENERQLAEVQKRLDDMLSKAYVLPDGRRVFKTEDGLRVFDEHGIELYADDIDPDLIEDWRPAADSYLPDLNAKHRLVDDRERKLELLDRIDAAEARIEAGDLTVEDIADIERELEAFAPIDVRNRIAGIDVDDVAPVRRDFGAAASPVYRNMNDLKLDMPSL